MSMIVSCHVPEYLKMPSFGATRLSAEVIGVIRAVFGAIRLFRHEERVGREYTGTRKSRLPDLRNVLRPQFASGTYVPMPLQQPITG